MEWVQFWGRTNNLKFLKFKALILALSDNDLVCLKLDDLGLKNTI